MEAAPRFVLPPRPSLPEPDTKEHERWCREEALVYEGGSFTTAYGNLAQLWAPGELPAATVPKVITRASYTAKRTNTIGGETKTVNVNAKDYLKYPSKRGGSAAAGEAFTVVAEDGTFTARVTGDIQTLIKWITEHRMQQFQAFTLYSGSGAQYGPFTPFAINA